MFSLFRKEPARSTTEIVDLIQKELHDYLKPLGFRKFGRTFNRVVDGDMVQVIHLQNGCAAKGVTGILWVNLGIRVPECFEHNFSGTEKPKKYYHEYECDIRVRLGELVDRRDSHYDLKRKPEKIAKDIIQRLAVHVMPKFDSLSSRDTILQRAPGFCELNKMLDCYKLRDAMIYGRRGDLETAVRLFNEYYDACARGEWESHNKAGELCITKEKPHEGHLRYLEELALKLNVPIHHP